MCTLVGGKGPSAVKCGTRKTGTWGCFQYVGRKQRTAGQRENTGGDKIHQDDEKNACTGTGKLTSRDAAKTKQVYDQNPPYSLI